MDEIRRELLRLALLVGSTTLGVGGARAQFSMLATSQRPKLSNPLSLKIEFADRIVQFAETDATSRIANTGTDIAQSWAVVRNPDLPRFTVIFVRDLSGERVEAWMHLAGPVIATRKDPMQDVIKLRLDSYTATLMIGETILYAARVPHHSVNRCWRLCAGPRPIVRDASALKASGLVPSYSQEATNGKPLSSFGKIYTPMGLAGITPSMGSTGERDEIGPVTECQAQWLATGSSTAYAQMMAQAEACGTLPWIIIDSATFSAIDVIALPKANTNWRGVQDGAPWYATDAGPDKIKVDFAHHPNLWYVPYLATEDPYYLWLGQAQTVAAILADNPAYKRRPGNVARQQERQVAWSLRDVIYAAKVAPRNPGGGFMSKAWFEQVLDNNRLTIEDLTMRAAHPQVKAFHVGPVVNYAGAASNGIAPWQEDMLTYIVGRAMALGFANWKPLHDWRLAFAIMRTSENTGWDRRFPTVYSLPFASNPETPAQLFASAKTQNRLPTQIAGVLWFDSARGWAYTFYLRGVLVEAGKIGNIKAADNAAWLTDALKQSHAKTAYKWAMI